MPKWSLAFLLSLASLFLLPGRGNAEANSPSDAEILRVELHDSKGTHGVSLSEKATVFEDKEARFTIDKILAIGLGQFSPISEFPLHPGYTVSHFWMFLTVHNAGSAQDWYLIPDYPLLSFEAYELKPDGTYSKAPTEMFETRFSTRRVKFEAGEEKRFLLEVWSPLVVNLQFKALNAHQLKSRSLSENILIGLLSGVFLAMIIYNVFLYANLRDKDYLFYLLFALVNTHLNLLSANYPEGIFSWFGIDWWRVVDFYRPLAPLTTLLFAQSFLQTKTAHPNLNRVINIYNVGLILLILCAFFVARHILFAWEDNYFLIAIGLLISAGILSLRRGFRPSHFYLVGLAFFVVGIGIYLLKSEGLVPSNAFTLNAHITFEAIEMLLMSLALSGKIKQLENSKTSAETTARVKSRLLRVISHDIANPLSIIKASAYVLKKENVSTARIEGIARAVGVIEEIMQFIRKTESLDDQKKLVTEYVSVAEVFDGLQFVFQKLAGDKSITMKFELEHPELFVKAEKTSLTYEVLGNFLANAIKFSHPGGEIHIHAAQHGKRVQISITDRGIGMTEEAVKAAFDPSINISRRGTAGEKGGGFGLLLAKAYLDQFGATVHIASVSEDVTPERSGTKITVIFAGTLQTNPARTQSQRWRLIP